jgi:hypothetical protein
MNVQTFNIVINQYGGDSKLEEEKINKMLNESIKSIAKIMENSQSNPNREKKIHKKVKIKARDLKDRPPRNKVRKVLSKTKKNKTVSLDSKEENKEKMDNLEIDLDNWEGDAKDAFNTFFDVPLKKLNLTEPRFNLKTKIHKISQKSQLLKQPPKPRLTVS